MQFIGIIQAPYGICRNIFMCNSQTQPPQWSYQKQLTEKEFKALFLREAILRRLYILLSTSKPGIAEANISIWLYNSL